MRGKRNGLPWAFVLAACGGGGGASDASPAVAEDYMPLPSNGRWIYTLDDGSAVRVDVSGDVPTSAGTGTRLITIDANGSVVDSSVLGVADGVVTAYPTDVAGSVEQSIGPVRVLDPAQQPGSSFTSVDKTVSLQRDFDGDGIDERMSMLRTVTLVAQEALDVPAGHFARTLRVRTDVHESVRLSRSGTTFYWRGVTDDWYAPGVGLVRTVATTYEDGSTASVPVTMSLSAWRVGSSRSDSSPETVVATAPSATARATGADVSVTFGKVVDASTLASGWRIVDAAGQVVEGHVMMVGATAHFVPDSAWAGGSYSATLGTGVTDLLGNALAQPLSWTFSLDASGPVLLSAIPADGASEVPVDSAIVLNFSEPVAPASVNAYGSMWASAGGEAVTFAAAVDGATVTLTPTTTWPSRKTLQLSIAGVTDVVGNPMSTGANLSFQIDSGAFGYPQALSPGLADYASEIVDLDGDGRPDFLFLSQTPDGRYSPFVRYGRAGGGLEAPVQLLAGDGDTCQANQLRAIDLDGDGRREVAVGGWCGWRLLRQAAARQFVAGETFGYVMNGADFVDLAGDGQVELVGLIDTDAAYLAVWRQDASHRFSTAPERTVLAGFGGGSLRLADLDGDGVPELVFAGGGNFASAISVWSRQTDGSYAVRSQMDSALQMVEDLAVGDVNGDGRPDIVVAMDGYPTRIGVFLQQPDGSFGPRIDYPTFSWPSAVRVADIDGDGHLDVVVDYSGWGTFGVFSQKADGSLAPETDYAAPYGSAMPSFAVGDLTGDGRPDVVLDGMLMRQRTPGSGDAAPLAMRGLAHALHAARAAQVPWALRHPAAAALRRLGAGS